MDKPLSQERLSELESAILFAKLGRLMGGDVIVSEKCIGEIQWAIAEVKRLQAIEAENNSLREALANGHDTIVSLEAERDDLIKLLNIIDYELEWGDAENAIDRCKALIRKVTEGVESHEA
jgi:hypothetical protein